MGDRNVLLPLSIAFRLFQIKVISVLTRLGRAIAKRQVNHYTAMVAQVAAVNRTIPGIYLNYRRSQPW